MVQAGFKCDNRKLFGAEFSKAIARAPLSVILMCDGFKAFCSDKDIDHQN